MGQVRRTHPSETALVRFFSFITFLLLCSRVGFYISTFKSVTNLEAKFHREISLVRTRTVPKPKHRAGDIPAHTASRAQLSIMTWGRG